MKKIVAVVLLLLLAWGGWSYWRWRFSPAALDFAKDVTHEELVRHLGIVKYRFRLPPGSFQMGLYWIDAENKRELAGCELAFDGAADGGAGKLLLWDLDKEKTRYALEVRGVRYKGIFRRTQSGSGTWGEFRQLAHSEGNHNIIFCDRVTKDGYYQFNQPLFKISKNSASSNEPILKEGEKGLFFCVHPVGEQPGRKQPAAASGATSAPPSAFAPPDATGTIAH